MKKVVCFAALAAVTLLMPSLGSAATIAPVGSPAGSVSLFPQVTTQELSGVVAGTSQLSQQTDFLEFALSTSSPVSSAVTVNVLSSALYPGETWFICSILACGTAIASGTADNTTQSTTPLAAGDYFFEFSSTAAPPASGGASTFTISVATTPLPATWFMMLTGLVGIGVIGCRRNIKAGLTAA
jgi:hypothetical protein